MSFIGKNIKKIRTIKKMSQSDFAQLFNLARPSVGAYEEGRTEPKIETLIQIAKYFELSIDTLLTKELTINELFKFDLFKADFHKDELQKFETDKDDVKEQTPFVSLEKGLDYLVNYANKDFINKLPVIQFPFTKTKKSRAFQIEGSEMSYEKCGLHHKDILLCSPVDDVADLKKDIVYVIVTQKEMITRRYSGKTDGFIFKADNPAYDDICLKKNEIVELWLGEAVFSMNLTSPTRIEERVNILEEKLRLLEGRLG